MNTKKLIVKMIFDRWNALVNNCDTLINTFSDETLLQEISPGKNRGIYLVGHLIAVHDDMLLLLDLGAKQHEELFTIFVESADKTVTNIPSATELRTAWREQVPYLKSKFEQLSPEEWFEKHTRVTTEEFVNEPHRNKLNIIITRTTHLAHHIGQLALLK